MLSSLLPPLSQRVCQEEAGGYARAHHCIHGLGLGRKMSVGTWAAAHKANPKRRHTSLCQPCRCGLFLAPEGHQGWGRRAESRWIRELGRKERVSQWRPRACGSPAGPVKLLQCTVPSTLQWDDSLCCSNTSTMHITV